MSARYGAVLLLIAFSSTVPRGGEALARETQPRVDSPAVALLREMLGLHQRDIDRARRGIPVVMSLESHDPREIGVLGIVAVRVAPEEYLRRLSDIERFKRDDAVLQIGRFSASPDDADVQMLALDPAEVQQLRDCRIGSCDMQLPASSIRIAAQEQWRGKNASRRASRLLQTQLLRQAQGYVQQTAGGAMVYMHRRAPITAADEFRRLVEDDTLVLPQLPTMRRRLLQSGLGSDDFLYWSREKIARKVVLSLTHVVVEQPHHPAVVYAVGSKQLYASNYFYASLGLTLLLQDETSPTSALVVYMNRSRVDAFDGWFGGLTRRLVRSRVKSAMQHHLERLKRRLER